MPLQAPEPMNRHVIAAIGLVAASFCYYFLSSFISCRRHARRARALGCLPTTQRPHRFPLGLDLVWALIQADRDHIVPTHLLDVYHELGDKATWVQNAFGSTAYFTADPLNIKALLATQFQDFELGSQRRGTFFPMLGNGIFTADGKAWEHSRALLRPQFARQQVADLQLEEAHVQDLFRHLPAGDGGWTECVDLVPLFFRLTLDSATEFLFGQSVGSQIAALPSHESKSQVVGSLDWSSFGLAFDLGTKALGERGRLADLYFLYNPKYFRESCKAVHKFADYYVNLALTNDTSPTGAEHKDTGKEWEKDRYIFLNELLKHTRDPIELRSQLLNILLAGRDTTAGLLGFTFLLLARHPDIYKKLRAVIVNDFGSYQRPKNLTFESLKACTYLHHILSETLRLCPMVPFNSRQATKDTTIARGGGSDGNSPVYIKKGEEVNYSVHIMHHRADIWGPDVEKFKPDRWIGRKPGWEFLPFNGGPRICLGQQFALTEAAYVVVRMLQRYDRIQTNETDPIMRYQYSLTTSPLKVPVRLHEAVV
ncbi:hypothetical protein LTR84_008653 [Exophiala bonariae]|uniref:Cytochrome P450 alkane hydroxylase n=1 Tax=Exophiala bonariae TaxID=1690606 RepID=A0AAV9MXB7_9EURO|nr:hypothetical protein LTR84_008653 [Exophiala bonariae]